MTLIPGPTLRIASGLVGLCLSLVMVADLMFGLFPNRLQQAQQTRARQAETTTVLVAEALRLNDMPHARATMEAVRSRDPDLLSLAVRRVDGQLSASSGPHAADWVERVDSATDATRILVPIQSPQGPWGRAEFAFAPVLPTTLAGWMQDRLLWLALGLPLLCLLAVYAYLKRVLLHLNPMATVPERLRDAFDGLTEGVALLDLKGRVVLANRALRDIAAVETQKMHGRPLQEAVRLELADRRKTPPWEQVLKGGDAVRGVRVYVGAVRQASREGQGGDPADPGQRKVAVINCSPITDPGGQVRGCLATLADMSDIERKNEELRAALQALQQSREKIEAQNVELVKLATRDGLTSLLNRRAFFEAGETAVQRVLARRGSLAVAMLDVDHFKRFNDTFGHATGDLVLQRVAQCVSQALRQGDIVARYGGEEFCVLMEDVDTSSAMALAERVRQAIESQAGRKLTEQGDTPVTASLGVCWGQVGPGADSTSALDLSAMLRQADAALYEAKRGGRNAVKLAGGTADQHPAHTAAQPALAN